MAALGTGCGVAIGQHVSVSAPHTNDLHADEYDDDDITINRTDVLSFGAGVRF
ncbi:hypothetical protein WIW49_00180 [Xanthomonas euroxanthea]